MEKNPSRFILLRLTHDWLNNLPALLHEIYNLLSLSFLFNISLMQDLFLIYLI